MVALAMPPVTLRQLLENEPLSSPKMLKMEVLNGDNDSQSPDDNHSEVTTTTQGDYHHHHHEHSHNGSSPPRPLSPRLLNHNHKDDDNNNEAERILSPPPHPQQTHEEHQKFLHDGWMCSLCTRPVVAEEDRDRVSHNPKSLTDEDKSLFVQLVLRASPSSSIVIQPPCSNPSGWNEFCTGCYQTVESLLTLKKEFDLLQKRLEEGVEKVKDAHRNCQCLQIIQPQSSSYLPYGEDGHNHGSQEQGVVGGGSGGHDGSNYYAYSGFVQSTMSDGKYSHDGGLDEGNNDTQHKGYEEERSMYYAYPPPPAYPTPIKVDYPTPEEEYKPVPMMRSWDFEVDFDLNKDLDHTHLIAPFHHNNMPYSVHPPTTVHTTTEYATDPTSPSTSSTQSSSSSTIYSELKTVSSLPQGHPHELLLPSLAGNRMVADDAACLIHIPPDPSHILPLSQMDIDKSPTGFVPNGLVPDSGFHFAYSMDPMPKMDYMDVNSLATSYTCGLSPDMRKSPLIPQLEPMSTRSSRKRKLSVKENQWGCVHCGLKFSTEKRLIKHIAANHKHAHQDIEGDGQFYPQNVTVDSNSNISPASEIAEGCNVCGKKYPDSIRLERHVRNCHLSGAAEGMRRFACNNCDKAFKHKHHLKEHQRLHSGEKPFECNRCGRKFSHSGSYSMHKNSNNGCRVLDRKEKTIVRQLM